MNYIQLVRRLRQETGVSGGSSGNEPATIASATRELRRLADWIASAWNEIQAEKPDWLWMKKPFSFNTVAGQQIYTTTDTGYSNFKRLEKDSCRVYLTSTGPANEIWLSHPDYNEFRDYYLFGPMRAITNRPDAITTDVGDVDHKIILGYIPDDIYTITGEYYTKPQELTTDLDTPNCPEEYHLAIVYYAMLNYGYFSAAQEQLSSGLMGMDRLLSRLRAEQSPRIGLGDSLI